MTWSIPRDSATGKFSETGARLLRLLRLLRFSVYWLKDVYYDEVDMAEEAVTIGEKLSARGKTKGTRSKACEAYLFMCRMTGGSRGSDRTGKVDIEYQVSVPIFIRKME